ncbi:hypothetical protein ILUMI_11982 [Ignelater luminosus]|uniref:N-acetyltransferase domain-containing protein n=1 Tax=Ignelater luminosus TaxID=2038154 RepID=A0A8K0G9Z8_IGNLU|nr:hypothetical protein ILUMI_11982 [Ignelater luminosus]
MWDDILQEISYIDIIKLKEIYKKYLPRTSHAYNYLNCVIKWKSSQNAKNYVTLMAPYGNWRKGTFIGIAECNCYEIFISTLEEDNEALCRALINTKKIIWNTRLLLYDVNSDLNRIAMKALEKTTFQFHEEFVCNLWGMSYKKARNLQINCPPEVYIDTLDSSHAELINFHWPHKYKDSENYIATLIEMNGGYGVFLKSNGALVTWIVRNLLGLGILQTLDEYKRRGYGSLITKVLSKEIGKEGLDPMGSVLKSNISSQRMFQNIGFEILGSVTFTENKEMRGYSHNSIL